MKKNDQRPKKQHGGETMQHTKKSLENNLLTTFSFFDSDERETLIRSNYIRMK